MSSKDSNEKLLKHYKSDNEKFVINFYTEELIDGAFEFLLHRYQVCLQQSVKGRKFMFDYDDELFYNFHKINVNHGGSYIDSP